MTKLEKFKFGTWYDATTTVVPEGEDCLVSNGTHIGYIGVFPEGVLKLSSTCQPFGEVTHWMPCPPLPDKVRHMSDMLLQ